MIEHKNQTRVMFTVQSRNDSRMILRVFFPVLGEITKPSRRRGCLRTELEHGSLLSLNAWKLGPTPRNFEMVARSPSNEPDNRCP